MNSNSNRPIAHQRVISLLKEVQAPPGDADTPNIPDELLDRLRDQYGRAQRRAIVEHKPGVWAWISDLFFQPKFALVTALLLICGTTAIMMQSPTEQDVVVTHPVVDINRGGEDKPLPAAVIPAYWLQSDKVEPAPGGIGLPKFIVLAAGAPLPAKGAAMIFDPAHHEARAMKDGTVTAVLPITDPPDWSNALRQLSKLFTP